jgi:hypothetical protein
MVLARDSRRSTVEFGSICLTTWHKCDRSVTAREYPLEIHLARVVHETPAMMNVIRTTSVLVLAAAGALCACGGSTTQTPAATGSPSRTPVGVANAQKVDANIVERLAVARCDREQSCNNVGEPHAKYASRDACLVAMRGDLGPELNGYDCPGGIDRAALDHCMTAIHEEGCGHPLDTLSRFDRCRAGNLCLK